MAFGSRHTRRRGHGQRTRAMFAALTLAVIALVAGCAAPGAGRAAASGIAAATAMSGTAAAAPARVTATAPAGAIASAGATALQTASRPTLARVASSKSPSAPAVSEPPPSGAAGSRLVTFANRMQQTIWVAASPDPGQPLAATGWVLPAGQTVTITVPNRWNGRFWGRTGCVFNGSGVGRCQTGDCGGLFQCTGYGQIPATLAEYDMDAWDNLDFYDVSMVDGSNLPMYINIAKSTGGTVDKISPDGCGPAGCTKPVDCPSVLDVKVGAAVVGCISACARLGGDQYCCQGPYAPRADCDPAKWPVDYAAVFKRAEPYAYSYVDDDATSVFTCSGYCDYRITFGITP